MSTLTTFSHTERAEMQSISHAEIAEFAERGSSFSEVPKRAFGEATAGLFFPLKRTGRRDSLRGLRGLCVRCLESLAVDLVSEMF